jgi:hypothetical protein
MVKGRFSIGFLGFTVELGEDDNGNIKLHGECFEATRDFRNFDLAVIFGATGARGEKLEVIDNKDFDVVLFFEAASAGTKLADGEKAGFVEEEGKFTDLGGNAPQGGDLAFVEFATSNLFRIEAGVGGKESKHELLSRHFKSEEGDRIAWSGECFFLKIPAVAEDMASHTEGEGGFAYARAGGDHDHFASFEAGGELIEFIEA